MSVKIVCEKENVKLEDFTVKKSNKVRHDLYLGDVKAGTSFRVKNMFVKIIPEKYDKVMVELNKQSLDFFKELENKIRKVINIENIINKNCISLKIKTEQRILFLDSVKRGDYIHGYLTFNGIWKINEKFYLSLELTKFRKIESSEVSLVLKNEPISYFIDD